MSDVAAVADGLFGVAELGDKVGELGSGIGAVLKFGEGPASDLAGQATRARSKPSAFINSPKRADSD